MALQTTKTHLNTLTFETPSALWSALMDSAYPVAIWRLPNDPYVHGISDLRPQIQNHQNLEDAGKGFYINPFLKHHPTQPQLIKGDLMIKWHQKKCVQTSFDVRLSDQDISDFQKALGDTNRAFHQRIASPDHGFRSDVVEAVQSIKKGIFDKVVLSRFDDQTLPENFELMKAFEAACEAYPNAFVYLVSTPNFGCWLGATPETLLEINDHQFKTVSLASTQKLRADQTLNEVAWTQKEIEEQAMVSRYIIDCFKKIRLREYLENGPKTVQAGRMAHLKTVFQVDMEAVNMPELGSTMLELLNPTSAVCGMPLQPALDFIKEYEKYDRELYAGFLGPINMEGHTHLFVNLRCMKIMGTTGRFYAGAGITENSNPEKEFEETQLKMQTLKRIVFQP
jgi:isochorismate synthase|tara:strand:+ start:1678 stop:2862 length:1185 start_codon:yes stop_codon:yes gene_type:complete